MPTIWGHRRLGASRESASEPASFDRVGELGFLGRVPGLGGKHVVVIGCGYVGRALAERVLAEGGCVTALVRSSESAQRLARLGVRVLAGDACADRWHGAIPGPVDLAVNALSAGGGGPEAYRKAYVESQRSIARWAGKYRVDHYIYTSSTGVYPQGGGAVVNEDAPLSPPTARSAMLAEAEQEALAVPARSAVTVLRLAGIYGPGRHHLLDALQRGETLFDGDGTSLLNLAYRDDIVDAIASAAESARRAHGIFNVADDRPASRAEVLSWLSEKLGWPRPSFSGIAPMRPRPNRRILAHRLKSATGWFPRHPSYREGYTAILLAARPAAAWAS